MFGKAYLGTWGLAAWVLLATSTGLAQEAAADASEEASSPARDEASERGRLHFQAAASHYDAGDYEDALREFERAYELSHKPELFYNFSLCHQQLGQLEDAIMYLERYLIEDDEISNRANLERRLTNLRERHAREGGATESTQSPGPPVAALVAFSVAGAGLVTLAVAGPLALSAKSDLQEMPCAATSECDASTLRTRAVVADIGLGLLVAGAAAGVILLFVGRGSPEDAEGASQTRVLPWASHERAGVSVRRSF